MDVIVFEEPWKGIKAIAYTDRYTYDPEDDSLLFISLAGTEQAVKSVSSAIIGGRAVSIRRQKDPKIVVSSHPASRFRVLSTRLPGGALHQLVADTRFFGNENGRGQLVLIPDHEDSVSAVYSQVLARLTSPLLPAWAGWICRQLKERELMRTMKGTLRAVDIRVDEAAIDQIISEGVKQRRISLY